MNSFLEIAYKTNLEKMMYSNVQLINTDNNLTKMRNSIRTLIKNNKLLANLLLN